MRTVPGIEALPAGLRFVCLIGAFDGPHRGHLHVLRATTDAAARLRAASVVVTFVPHPEQVFRGAAPVLLADPDEQARRLEAAGIDWLVRQPFDRAFAALEPEAFVDLLADGRDLAAIVMTPESAFGHKRSGTPDRVAAIADARGFELVRTGTLDAGHERVSSSRIREHIHAGRLRAASRLLGRPHAVTGTVVHGDARGRQLGYPTANLSFEQPVCLPPNGIYAVRVSWGGDDPLNPRRTADGVASLGVRPTFGAGERILEVHLFDFDELLYGERLRVEFVRRQRGERRFDGVAALVRQMDADAARARHILAADRGARTHRSAQQGAVVDSPASQ